MENIVTIYITIISSLVIAVVLTVLATIVPTNQWCLFSYPCYLMGVDQTTVCGIDSERGAKLFPFRCMLHQSNACNNTNYKPASFRQCLDRNPNVIQEYATEIIPKIAIINQRAYRRHLRRMLWLYAVMGRLWYTLRQTTGFFHVRRWSASEYCSELVFHCCEQMLRKWES